MSTSAEVEDTPKELRKRLVWKVWKVRCDAIEELRDILKDRDGEDAMVNEFSEKLTTFIKDPNAACSQAGIELAGVYAKFNLPPKLALSVATAVVEKGTLSSRSPAKHVAQGVLLSFIENEKTPAVQKALLGALDSKVAKNLAELANSLADCIEMFGTVSGGFDSEQIVKAVSRLFAHKDINVRHSAYRVVADCVWTNPSLSIGPLIGKLGDAQQKELDAAIKEAKAKPKYVPQRVTVSQKAQELFNQPNTSAVEEGQATVEQEENEEEVEDRICAMFDIDSRDPSPFTISEDFLNIQSLKKWVERKDLLNSVLEKISDDVCGRLDAGNEDVFKLLKTASKVVEKDVNAMCVTSALGLIAAVAQKIGRQSTAEFNQISNTCMKSILPVIAEKLKDNNRNVVNAANLAIDSLFARLLNLNNIINQAWADGSNGSPLNDIINWKINNQPKIRGGFMTALIRAMRANTKVDRPAIMGFEAREGEDRSGEDARERFYRKSIATNTRVSIASTMAENTALMKFIELLIIEFDDPVDVNRNEALCLLGLLISQNGMLGFKKLEDDKQAAEMTNDHYEIVVNPYNAVFGKIYKKYIEGIDKIKKGKIMDFVRGSTLTPVTVINKKAPLQANPVKDMTAVSKEAQPIKAKQNIIENPPRSRSSVSTRRNSMVASRKAKSPASQSPAKKNLSTPSGKTRTMRSTTAERSRSRIATRPSSRLSDGTPRTNILQKTKQQSLNLKIHVPELEQPRADITDIMNKLNRHLLEQNEDDISVPHFEDKPSFLPLKSLCQSCESLKKSLQCHSYDLENTIKNFMYDINCLSEFAETGVFLYNGTNSVFTEEFVSAWFGSMRLSTSQAIPQCPNSVPRPLLNLVQNDNFKTTYRGLEILIKSFCQLKEHKDERDIIKAFSHFLLTLIKFIINPFILITPDYKCPENLEGRNIVVNMEYIFTSFTKFNPLFTQILDLVVELHTFDDDWARLYMQLLGSSVFVHELQKVIGENDMESIIVLTRALTQSLIRNAWSDAGGFCFESVCAGIKLLGTFISQHDNDELRIEVNSLVQCMVQRIDGNFLDYLKSYFDVALTIKSDDNVLAFKDSLVLCPLGSDCTCFPVPVILPIESINQHNKKRPLMTLSRPLIPPPALEIIAEIQEAINSTVYIPKNSSGKLVDISHLTNTQNMFSGLGRLVLKTKQALFAKIVEILDNKTSMGLYGIDLYNTYITRSQALEPNATECDVDIVIDNMFPSDVFYMDGSQEEVLKTPSLDATPKHNRLFLNISKLFVDLFAYLVQFTKSEINVQSQGALSGIVTKLLFASNNTMTAASPLMSAAPHYMDDMFNVVISNITDTTSKSGTINLSSGNILLQRLFASKVYQIQESSALINAMVSTTCQLVDFHLLYPTFNELLDESNTKYAKLDGMPVYNGVSTGQLKAITSPAFKLCMLIMNYLFKQTDGENAKYRSLSVSQAVYVSILVFLRNHLNAIKQQLFSQQLMIQLIDSTIENEAECISNNIPHVPLNADLCKDLNLLLKIVLKKLIDSYSTTMTTAATAIGSPNQIQKASSDLIESIVYILEYSALYGYTENTNSVDSVFKNLATIYRSQMKDKKRLEVTYEKVNRSIYAKYVQKMGMIVQYFQAKKSDDGDVVEYEIPLTEQKKTAAESKSVQKEIFHIVKPQHLLATNISITIPEFTESMVLPQIIDLGASVAEHEKTQVCQSVVEQKAILEASEYNLDDLVIPDSIPSNIDGLFAGVDLKIVDERTNLITSVIATDTEDEPIQPVLDVVSIVNEMREIRNMLTINDNFDPLALDVEGLVLHLKNILRLERGHPGTLKLCGYGITLVAADERSASEPITMLEMCLSILVDKPLNYKNVPKQLGLFTLEKPLDIHLLKYVMMLTSLIVDQQYNELDSKTISKLLFVLLVYRLDKGLKAAEKSLELNKLRENCKALLDTTLSKLIGFEYGAKQQQEEHLTPAYNVEVLTILVMLVNKINTILLTIKSDEFYEFLKTQTDVQSVIDISRLFKLDCKHVCSRNLSITPDMPQKQNVIHSIITPVSVAKYLESVGFSQMATSCLDNNEYKFMDQFKYYIIFGRTSDKDEEAKGEDIRRSMQLTRTEAILRDKIGLFIIMEKLVKLVTTLLRLHSTDELSSMIRKWCDGVSEGTRANVKKYIKRLEIVLENDRSEITKPTQEKIEMLKKTLQRSPATWGNSFLKRFTRTNTVEMPIRITMVSVLSLIDKLAELRNDFNSTMMRIEILRAHMRKLFEENKLGPLDEMENNPFRRQSPSADEFRRFSNEGIYKVIKMVITKLLLQLGKDRIVFVLKDIPETSVFSQSISKMLLGPDEVDYSGVKVEEDHLAQFLAIIAGRGMSVSVSVGDKQAKSEKALDELQQLILSSIRASSKADVNKAKYVEYVNSVIHDQVEALGYPDVFALYICRSLTDRRHLSLVQ